MWLIDADDFKRKVAAAAMLNGSSVAADRAVAIMNVVDMQPSVDLNLHQCEGCKWESTDVGERVECSHCSRAYSDEYESIK
ncbi:MAG: hypothetical protein ACRDBO_00115 [Lachnospiraceae bacterium]